MARLTPRQQQDLLTALRKRLDPGMADAFLSVIQAIADSVDVTKLTAAIKAGRVDEAVAMFNQLRALYFPLDDAIRAAYIEGGKFALAYLPALRNPLNGTSLAIGFDGRHVRAEAWARERAAQLITGPYGIIDEQRELVRDVIVRGIAENRNTAEIARDIVGRVNPLTGKREGGLIGLSAPQTQTLMNARNDLNAGTPSSLRTYLSRSSRNRTYDALVNRAIKGEATLTAAQIEQILAGQKNKMLKQRGQTIATNETYTALSAGQHEGWQQLIDSGAVKAVDVEKRWQHNRNDPFRKDHLAMSGTVVDFNGTFSLGGVAMKHDHDPNGGMKNNLGCHCTTFYRLRKGRDGQ